MWLIWENGNLWLDLFRNVMKQRYNMKFVI